MTTAVANPQDQSLRQFLIYSIIMHTSVAVVIAVSAYIQFRENRWGGIGGELGGMKVSLVSAAGSHSLALGDNRFLWHGDAGRTDQTHFHAAEFASDAAPAILSKLNIGRNGNHNGNARVHDDGIDEELPKALVLRIGDGGSHAY